MIYLKFSQNVKKLSDLIRCIYFFNVLREEVNIHTLRFLVLLVIFIVLCQFCDGSKKISEAIVTVPCSHVRPTIVSPGLVRARNYDLLLAWMSLNPT